MSDELEVSFALAQRTLGRLFRLTDHCFGQQSLLESLDLQQMNALNESEDHILKNILIKRSFNEGDAYLLSDVDEELLLNIPVRSALLASARHNAPTRLN